MTKMDPIAYPPRGMDKITACRYVGLSLSLFDDMVKDGRLPPPRLANSKLLWDRVALDVAFTSLPEKTVDGRSTLEKMLADK